MEKLPIKISVITIVFNGAELLEGTIKSVLDQTYPNIEYLFLSVDRTDRAWKNGIRKYNLKGQHYFLPNGQKGALGDFLNSNWIPRYLILDKDGNIALFKAKSAKDKNIKLTLDKLTN